MGAVAVALVTVPAGTAAAATHVVGSDGKGCPQAAFTAIQAAVDAASPGDTVVLCRGVFREAVTIPAGKAGLQLRARTDGAVITAPKGHGGPIVAVQADDVRLHRLRIAGPFAADDGCTSAPGALSGVRVAPSAEGVEVLSGVVEDIAASSPGACAAGAPTATGVEVLGQAAVIGNVVRGYAGTGIRIAGPAASAQVRGNQLHGLAEPPGGPTVGIQLEGTGGPVSVTNNNAGIDDTALSLIGTWGPVRIVNNNADANDTALSLRSTTGPVAVRHNDFEGGAGPAIRVHAAQGVLVEHNRMHDSASGLRLEELAGPARILRNSIFSNGDVGLVVIGTRDAEVEGNVVRGNGGGIHVAAASTGNSFERNDARGNVGTDCRDDSTGGLPGAPAFGTRNSWRSNAGDDALPVGICAPRSG